MFKPYYLYLGLKYTLGKHKEGFISFIHFNSVLGISFGVAILITVTSVFNGFNKEIRSLVYGNVPHITVINFDRFTSSEVDYVKKIVEPFNPISVTSFLNINAAAKYKADTEFISIMGMELNSFEHFNKSIYPFVKQLKTHKNSLVISHKVAQKLRLTEGSEILLIVDQSNNESSLGFKIKRKKFKVVGIYKDSGLLPFSAYGSIKTVSQLSPKDKAVSGVYVNIQNPNNAFTVKESISEKLNYPYSIYHWADILGSLFKSIEHSKLIFILLMFFIILIACFNISATLILIVEEKKKDIAILMTMGARPTEIMRVFIFEGLLNGIIGIIIGVTLGIILSLNISSIVAALESSTGHEFINESVYFLDYLPAEISVNDIIWISLFTLLLSLSAAIYPSLKSALTDPVEVIRNS